MSSKKGEYYGYKHWTLEEHPRCFNVGRGRKGRAYDLKARNRKHKEIARIYGIRVEICIGPVSFERSNEWEIEWIAKENTFTMNYSHHDLNDIGCNFTLGGGGSTGCTTGKLGDENPSKRPEVRAKISKTLSGRLSPSSKYKRSVEERAKISLALTGLKQSDETIAKRSLKMKGKPQRCGLCKEFGHKRYLCPTLPEDVRVSLTNSHKKNLSIGVLKTSKNPITRAKRKQHLCEFWSSPAGEMAKIRASIHGRSWMENPEAQQKVSNAGKLRKGSTFTEEQRLHNAASHNKMSLNDVEMIERLLTTNIKQVDIARLVGVSPMAVTTVKFGRQYHQRLRAFQQKEALSTESPIVEPITGHTDDNTILDIVNEIDVSNNVTCHHEDTYT